MNWNGSVVLAISWVDLIGASSYASNAFQLAEWGERPLSDLCNCGEDHIHSCDDEKKRVVLLGLQLLALVSAEPVEISKGYFVNF